MGDGPAGSRLGRRGAAAGGMARHLLALRRKVRLFALARDAPRDPVPFCRETAAFVIEYLDRSAVPLGGRRWLDAGTGAGAVAEALAGTGAAVVALDVEDHRAQGIASGPFVRARAQRMPFGEGAFDGAISSNVLEHTRDAAGMISDLARVIVPGGFLYLSWTNWLSPWGGHEISPFHYLGPRTGCSLSRWVRGKGPAENEPGRTLFVRHVGRTLRTLRGAAPELTVVDVCPRYWPSLRFLGRVPGLREVAMWNCVVLLRKGDGGS